MAAHDYTEARAGYRLYLEEAELVDLDEAARIKSQIGRTYFEQRSYSQASRWFAEVVDDYGASSSVWEALYYGGINYVRMGECARATLYFGKLLQASLTLDGERGAEVGRYRASAEKHLKTIEQDMAHSHKLCPIGSAPGL